MQKQAIESPSGSAVPQRPIEVESDNDTSLADVWLVIRKRWLWPLAGLVLGVLVAIAYVVLTDPIYESRASIQIGKMHDIGLIEDVDALAIQLIDQYGPESDGGARRETSESRSD
jgi:uncharacterized protein involved in exopolysaccharide biosynthesis